MNLIQFVFLTAGLFLSLAWVLRSPVPEAVGIKVRDVVLDLQDVVRNRRDAGK